MDEGISMALEKNKSSVSDMIRLITDFKSGSLVRDFNKNRKNYV